MFTKASVSHVFFVLLVVMFLLAGMLLTRVAVATASRTADLPAELSTKDWAPSWSAARSGDTLAGQGEAACSPLLSGSGQWAKTYGGTHDDFARSIQQTSDGGYIVAGKTSSSGAGGDDIWVLKLDASGNVAWQKAYGGDNHDEAHAIQQTADGGYIVAGETYTFGAGNYDVWILKLDSAGNVTWQNTYGGTHDDYAYSIQQTADSGYIVAGKTTSFGAGGPDVWLLKLDASGSVTWQKTYGKNLDDWANSIRQTPDGGYIMAGGSVGGGWSAFWIVKLDASGNVTWEKLYGGSEWDEASFVQQTSDGGYIVAGWTASFSADHHADIWVLKLDTNGDIAWQKVYGGTGYEKAYAIQQTSNGGYIVAGFVSSFGAGNDDVWGFTLDASGNILWEKTYGTALGDQAYSVQQTTDGGYVVAGYDKLYNSLSGADFLVLKLDANGDVANCPTEGTSSATVTIPTYDAGVRSPTVKVPSYTKTTPSPTVTTTTIIQKQVCPTINLYLPLISK